MLERRVSIWVKKVYEITLSFKSVIRTKEEVVRGRDTLNWISTLDGFWSKGVGCQDTGYLENTGIGKKWR